MATDNEIFRYYEILSHIKDGKFIEKLPIVDRFNGADRTEPICRFESYKIWDENAKIITAKQVKDELPALEEKYNQLKLNYYLAIKTKEDEAKKLREKEMLKDFKDFNYRFIYEERLKMTRNGRINVAYTNLGLGWSQEKEKKYKYLRSFFEKLVDKKITIEDYKRLLVNTYKL